MAEEKAEPKRLRTIEETEPNTAGEKTATKRSVDSQSNSETLNSQNSSNEGKKTVKNSEKKDGESSDKKAENKGDDNKKNKEPDKKEKKIIDDNKNDDKGKDNEEDDIKDKIKNASKLADMAHKTYKLLNALHFFMWLKYMMSVIANAIAAAAKAFIGLIMKGVSFLLGSAGFYAISAAIGSVLGIGTVAGGAVVVIAVGVTTAIVAVVGIAGAMGGYNTAYKDAPITVVECSEGVIESSTAFETSQVLNAGYKEIETENANKIYSIFKAAGFPDTNIAGILGNWAHESGLDPTAFISIYDEPYQIGPRKQAVIDGGYVNTAIGLGQWRGGRKESLIEFGKKYNSSGIWYELETEMQFTLTGDGGNSDILNNWKLEEEENPESAAFWFGENWERAGIDYSPRAVSAADFYSRMQNGSIVADVSFGQSILEATAYVSEAASDTATANKAKTCDEINKLTASADNSTIVSAAVSLCHSYTEFASESVRNTSDWGTELYQEVNNAIHRGPRQYNQYRDCGRYVSAVVRWCGADKDYCTGDTASQYAYLCSSPKWQEIDWNGDYTNLSPGDVLITGGKGHVCIYAGYDAIAAVFSDTPADKDVVICSASMDGNSAGYPPCCRNFYSELATFHAFRCVKPDNDTTYKDVGTNTAIKQATDDKPSAGEAPSSTQAP